MRTCQERRIQLDVFPGTSQFHLLGLRYGFSLAKIDTSNVFSNCEDWRHLFRCEVGMKRDFQTTSCSFSALLEDRFFFKYAFCDHPNLYFNCSVFFRAISFDVNLMMDTVLTYYILFPVSSTNISCSRI